MEKRYRALKILIAVVFAAFIVFVLLLNFLFPFKYSREVNQSADEFGLEPRLIYAVIWTESKFKKDAESKAGAKGLMQLMPSTARFCAQSLDVEYDESKLFEPAYNIRLGAFYLSYLIDKYGEKTALAAYNAGEGNILKWGGKIEFAETRDYVKRALFVKKIYGFKSK